MQMLKEQLGTKKPESYTIKKLQVTNKTVLKDLVAGVGGGFAISIK